MEPFSGLLVWPLASGAPGTTVQSLSMCFQNQGFLWSHSQDSDNCDVHKHAMRAPPFRSSLAMSQYHSHHVLCIANFAFQEVTHQNGFTLYVFESNSRYAALTLFLSMSVTMHRQCMTCYTSVNPTTKHLSLVRHGHLRCLSSLPETSTEGTEIYAMSAIEMHSDMISTCSNLDTQN